MIDQKKYINEIKKAAFLHDLGKILNWSGVLHPLEGARVLRYLGFSDKIVGAALYHHGKEYASTNIENLIDDSQRQYKAGTDCAGLKAYNAYDKYIIELSQLVDKLTSGFDRLGDPEKAGRTKPIVLRNPITHLPMNGELKEFKATVNKSGASKEDSEYLREYVMDEYLKKRNGQTNPDIKLKKLDSDSKKDVYELTSDLHDAELLRVLSHFSHSDKGFNEFYRALKANPSWQELAFRLIPQAQHPPADTLALGYHLQFSSALSGLYYLEGFNNYDFIKEEHDRLKNKSPLHLKIGLLYIKIKGLKDYFETAYRLPDFTGTQRINEKIKEVIKYRLLKRELEGIPIVWEDSFFYEGHDDFLVVIPIDRINENPGTNKSDEDKYVFPVDSTDKFVGLVEIALDTDKILQEAVHWLFDDPKLCEILNKSADDEEVFDDGKRLVENLNRFISITCKVKAFAKFKDGTELRPLYGRVWNKLRTKAASSLPPADPGVGYFEGDICDSCRRNLAGHDPDVKGEWKDKDWDRKILKDEPWADRPLYYWVFRSDSKERGEGDKLCHACLLRRMLGKGTSLEKITGCKGEESEARIAVIKGNVNRTTWYIGGGLEARAALANTDSVYSIIWRDEISKPIAEKSLIVGQKDMRDALKALKEQAGKAAPDESNAPRISLPPLNLSCIGLSSVGVDNIITFLDRSASNDPFEALQLRGLHYNPQKRQWQKMENALRNIYLQTKKNINEAANLLIEAQNLIKEQVSSLPVLLSQLQSTHPNPWYPYPLMKDLDDVIPFLISGSPNFTSVKQSDNDLPTPSRTMTVSWLMNKAAQRAREVAEKSLQKDDVSVVYAEGDEFLIICRAENATDLARRIFRAVVSELNSLPDDRVEKLEKFFPFTLAMGMVVAKKKHPMYDLLELVDLLLANAKQRYNRNAIDFENIVGGVDEKYLDRGLFAREWLVSRPLPLEIFANLQEYIQKLEEDKLAQRQLHLLAGLIASVDKDVVPEGEAADLSRQVAALTYVLKHGDEGVWEILRKVCEDETFLDLLTLQRIVKEAIT